jgi:hypothetical protein
VSLCALQFALDEHGLFGSNVLACKGAGLELQALNELVVTGVNGINFALVALIDVGGRRLIASSVLPINGRTLCYGSADAGKTVFGINDIPNPQARQAVLEASSLLNLKVLLAVSCGGLLLFKCRGVLTDRIIR